MAERVRPIEPRRGRWLEDFAVGQRFDHWPGRTATEADNISFSLLTMNRHPLHCDRAFAEASGWGQPLVNSAPTLAIVVGTTVDDVSADATANLGWKEIRLTAPVFPGDTVYARSEVLDVRPSRSRLGEATRTWRGSSTRWRPSCRPRSRPAGSPTRRSWTW